MTTINQCIITICCACLSACQVEEIDFHLPNRCGDAEVSVYPSPEYKGLFGDAVGQLSRGNITGSYQHHDGTRFWFINDAFVNTPTDVLMVRNSIAVEEAGEFRLIIGEDTGNPTALISSEHQDQWVSLNNGQIVGDMIEIVATLFQKTGGGPYDFSATGTLIVQLNARTFQIESMDRAFDSSILWGSSVFSNDEHVYVYGTRNKDYGKEIFLARSKDNRISGRWEFYDGYSWSLNVDDARPIANTLTNVSDYFTVFQRNDRFFLVSQAGLFGEEIFLYSSHNLERDWRYEQILYCRSTYDDAIAFNTIVHEVEEQKLTCSYSLIDGDLTDFVVLSNAFIEIRNWRPRF